MQCLINTPQLPHDFFKFFIKSSWRIAINTAEKNSLILLNIREKRTSFERNTLKESQDVAHNVAKFYIRLVLQILTLFQTKICNFSHLFLDMASKKLCYHYLDSNIFYFKFEYFSFFFTHLEMKRQMRSPNCVVPSKTKPDSRPKRAKSLPVFRPKRDKNPTQLGDT